MKHFQFKVVAAICCAFAPALNAGDSYQRGAVPPELIGVWMHTDWQAGYGHFDPDRVDQFNYNNQDPVGWRDGYRFFPDGSYQHTHFASLDVSGCEAKTLQREIGWVIFRGQSITLVNHRADLSAQDRCHRQNNFNARNANTVGPRTFLWRIARNRNGRPVLLLKGEDGRTINYQVDSTGHL
jgi:hypothetical protein